MALADAGTGAPHLVLWWPLGELLASTKQAPLNSRLQLGCGTHSAFLTLKAWLAGCSSTADPCVEEIHPTRSGLQGGGCSRVALVSSVVDSSCSQCTAGHPATLSQGGREPKRGTPMRPGKAATLRSTLPI